ncbi:hypothetical protein ACH40D_30705 [Streptomyces olivaceoviridis]|uniref:Leucine-rich repeat domain-containing protein n=1 Tax=Streptomyces olivaceoviridis TaxID=1921 RepID=A0ABW7VL64_STROI|nr:hypothetical protein [Streptomyces corchorusii]
MPVVRCCGLPFGRAARPPSVGGPRRLCHLDLRNNRLGELPDAVAGLTEPTPLALRGCAVPT